MFKIYVKAQKHVYCLHLVPLFTPHYIMDGKGSIAECFTVLTCVHAGSKVVDCLMESKWTEKPKEDDHITPYFTSRASATKYLGE